MGVDGRLLNRRKPEMNDRAPHTAPEVPPCPPVPEPSEDVPTVKLFDPWREAEDIEVLKSKMKLQLRREVVGEVAIPPSISGLDSVSSMLYKSAGGHEMSMSLPNLSSSLKTEDINTTNDKLTRSSLSDIYDSAPVEFQIVNDKSHSDLAKELDLNRLRLNECPPCREKGGRGHVSTGLSTDIRGPKLLKPSNTVPGCSEPRDLTINVSQCNNRLSAVLENIPLFYIPHTKQLISVNPGTSTNAKADSKNTAEHHSIPKLQCQSEPSCDTILAQTHSDFADFCAVESHDDTLTSPPGPTLCLQNGGTAQPVTNGGINSCNTSLSKTKFLSNSDLENSMALSQDSDASSRSEHTVIHQDEYHSQGKHEDFDAESIDELTKISLERDSPKHPLHRTSTMGSINDASSFSSISSISTGTDFSASATSYSDDYIDVKGVVTDCDEAGFMDVNLHSRNTFERSRNSSQDSGIDEKGFHGAKPKRRGITGFFTRSLFSKKPKDTVDQSQNQSAPGWKLFGRIPPKHTTPKDPTKISQEYQAKYKVQQQQPQCPRTKKSDVEVSSTTALILEQRPKGLPSKDPEEELRHKQEYEAMVEAAKKREVKEAKQKKRMMQQQLKQEEALTAALRVWNSEILTNWDSTRNSKKARDLWWLGIPPSVRGKVWKLAIGNELNLTSELYEICLNRAKDRLKLINETSDSEGSQEPAASKESSVELIKLDVSRTFPPLCIFQKGGPYHELLQGLLGAYACYRPDVGYVQGMSFIAAVLLLNMEEADAFICFANLLNRPCQIAFFRLDESLMKSYFETYEEFFLENLPKLYDHFEKQGLTPDLYIIDWMFTLYAKSLPLDVASRVWDVFCRDGEEFLFRTALGILKMYEEVLLNMDFIHLAQFLTKLPDNISGEQIFHCVESIHMTIDKRKFNQVLANVRDLKET